MYSVRSTQKLQTLRWARFGLASRGGIFGFLLLLYLERDLVRVDVAGGVLGHRRQVVAAGTVRHADGGAPRLEELNVGRHHLGRLPLLAVLALPGASLEPALDVDQGTLAEVVGDLLREVSAADVPGHDVVVVGVLAALTVLPAPIAVGRDRELAHRIALGGVPDLRVARQATHQHDFVEAGHLAFTPRPERPHRPLRPGTRPGSIAKSVRT